MDKISWEQESDSNKAREVKTNEEIKTEKGGSPNH